MDGPGCNLTAIADFDWCRRVGSIDIVARLKQESEVPLRSHGSLSLNRTLMAAGLVDRVQVTVFPVITGQTGTDHVFRGAADFDLELIESQTLGDNILELIYRPTLHVGSSQAAGGNRLFRSPSCSSRSS